MIGWQATRWLWRPCGLVVLLGGCYAYAPVDRSMTAPSPGESIRIVLNQPAPVALRDYTVTYAVRVDGEFVHTDTTDVILSAWWVVADGGLGYGGIGESVTVPWRNISRLERRALSVPRTGLATAGIVAGAFVLGSAMFAGIGSGENGGPPPVIK